MNNGFWKKAGTFVAILAVLGLVALSFFPQGIQPTVAPAPASQ